ncbi:DUF3833 family protein [Pseudoalteromonas luteoviolacea]|uniref:DUF3833 domain-containing protein n=1 Tax=Pseudoalteromonas luteoviolacea S4054 TaxID=1129367 RepID=A0A0F6AAK3_9GAMM|nr:DUF3833 family protein [Pseudoalteromonas luteoviolacea]AOT10813.1 hypothetical protein S4054249_23475 [Pseudoalteromonas luteoviolacea]AOT16025.1 hypothetical protein S40542_25035 [Pseudoalteromonas luteoviolacea]AOT20634.1 hypothetical protein S4054_23395 [Pseudoalteromonas luteoviolacea]KKE82856.1 hypothetical protein N479_16420 [Pseudoalteromonas luteoviolacea S4054]KZN75263.1 hypothetical protein N481_08065 [Pseudoalteromonas luteoviolacea S4047-1]
MKMVVLLCALVLLSACRSSVQSDVYQNMTPNIDVYDFFDGQVNAWGIVQNRSGELVQRFKVRIEGSVNHVGELVLDEAFTYGYGDGVKQRVWTIKNGDNGLTGSAPDIATTAIGTVYGNALRWQYEMDLPVDDTTYRVVFDDWMWAFDKCTLMNRSYIKKFGLVMAEVTIFMQNTEVSKGCTGALHP